jgi:polysaccharide biosynthesis protein PslH
VRILWVKANKLLPLHSGGDIRSYHIARHLASAHPLTFLSYYDGVPDPGYEKELAAEFPGCVCICTGKSESKFSRVGNYLRQLGHRAPFAVSRFQCAKVQRTIESLLRGETFDIAVCDFLDAAINFPSALPIAAAVFQHNVESEIWRRHAAIESNPIKRLIYRLEFRKFLSYESATIRKFQRVIAVSEHDRQLMSAWVDGSGITVVPTGVDLRQYSPSATANKSRIVTFVGAMDWEPNIDAMEYFCREIWPQVISAVPDARLRIVGRNPDRRIESFASKSVEVTGRVRSVVDHLHQAAVVVVPLRIGGGTRLKIYEAMAAGKAVVSTTMGAEGLDVHNGKDIVIAELPGKFAEAVVSLLLKDDLRQRYEIAAAELASHFDWSAIAQRFGLVLQETISGRAGALERCVIAQER